MFFLKTHVITWEKNKKIMVHKNVYSGSQGWIWVGAVACNVHR